MRIFNKHKSTHGVALVRCSLEDSIDAVAVGASEDVLHLLHVTLSYHLVRDGTVASYINLKG